MESEVPFELYNNGLTIVKGSIGAIRNVNIILDTGTNPTTISKQMADDLNLQGIGELQFTLNGAVPVQAVVLSRIQIGGLTVGSIKAVVQDLSFLDHKLGISIAGIAGLDVLTAGNFMIDYRKKNIVFGQMKARRNSVPFATRTPFLAVKAKIEGQPVLLLLDSGSFGLLLYRNCIRIPPEQLYPDGNALIESAAGTMRSRWFLASSVKLGKENLGQRSVVIADLDRTSRDDFDGLLGFVNMGFHQVFFDFENGRFGWN